MGGRRYGKHLDSADTGSRRYARSAQIAACVFILANASTPLAAQTWSAVKEDLSARGITPSVVYDSNLLTNAAGGLKQDSVGQGSLFLQLQIDSEKFFGFPGLKIYMSELVGHGPNPDSGIVGDAQGVNGLTVRPGFRTYENWVQYNFLDNQWSVLIGQYDIATEFYRSQTAGLFLNTAFGTGSAFNLSGVEGPSNYPYTALGARVAYKPLNNLVFRTAILDGVPFYRPDDKISPFRKGDGLLIVSEAAWARRDIPEHPTPHPHIRIGRFSGLSPYDDKFAVGGWYYTANFNSLNEVDQNGNPVQKRGSAGAYTTIDRVLFEQHGDPKKQIAAFLQLGVAEQNVNRFGSYYGTGLAAIGMIPGRPKDEFGFAVAIARNGFSYMQAQEQQGIPVNRAESAFEVTYLAQINDWLAIQPDLQYVVHPNTDPTVRNALVFQLRAEIAF